MDIIRVPLLSLLSLLLSSCALDVGSTAQQVGTCVSDPIAPGGGDGDVVPQCPPPPGIQDATANALAVAANHIGRTAPTPPPYVLCSDTLGSCATFFYLDDLTYLRTTCYYAIPILCSSEEFARINGEWQLILIF